MTRNLHDKPFDAETLIKLELFEMYTKEWLPAMIMSRPGKAICIFDFFAGPGYDKKRIPGSPIRILAQIKGQYQNIINKRVGVYVWFNEFSKKKYDILDSCTKSYIMNSFELKQLEELKLLKLKVTNEDFADLFPKVKDIIVKFPTLAILDQNGIKFTSEEYFISLCTSKNTDFLYYLSSSYFVRFGEEKSFQMNLRIDMERALAQPYKYIHESIIQQLKERIPTTSNVRLYPFTIKKDSNIYGIIFGASHIRAVDKFLRTAWKLNEINGCANFDIDNDVEHSLPNLFGDEMRVPTKIERFKKCLREYILNNTVKTNEDVFLFTMEKGHIPTHATEEIKLMKKEGLIEYDARSPMVNYDEIYNNKRIIEFILK
ncbi:MAG: three-Cys-motif partner protein TcmP [Prevotella sp.]|nr:three-Cys-motif partner protein TcmP [Prevotella sp.]